MSRLTASSQPTLGLSFETRVAGVLATLGHLPDATIGLLGIRFFDFMDNHRKKVARNAGESWPAGARAQRFVFAYSNRYGARKIDPDSFRDLVGESFMFPPQAVANPARFWELFERGGVVSGDAAMTIPFRQGAGPLGTDIIGRGVVARTFQRLGFEEGAARQKAAGALPGEFFDVGVGGVLIDPDAARGDPRGLRGVLRRTLTRKPRLKFGASYEAIKDRHLAKIDKVFDQALTATGPAAQAAIVQEAQEKRLGRNQFSFARDGKPRRTEFDRNLARYLSNLRAAGVPKKVREEAKRLVEADRLKDRTRVIGGAA